MIGPATPALTDPALLAACVAVGLAASVVPYGLEQLAMRRLPRARFALLLSLLPATAAFLTNQAWLGNVRELRNALEHAVIVARDGPLLPEHLPASPGFCGTLR